MPRVAPAATGGRRAKLGTRRKGTGRKTTPRDFELKGRRTGVAAPATGVGATPRRGADGFEELEDWFGDSPSPVPAPPRGLTQPGGSAVKSARKARPTPRASSRAAQRAAPSASSGTPSPATARRRRARNAILEDSSEEDEAEQASPPPRSHSDDGARDRGSGDRGYAAGGGGAGAGAGGAGSASRGSSSGTHAGSPLGEESSDEEDVVARYKRERDAKMREVDAYGESSGGSETEAVSGSGAASSSFRPHPTSSDYESGHRSSRRGSSYVDYDDDDDDGGDMGGYGGYYDDVVDEAPLRTPASARAPTPRARSSGKRRGRAAANAKPKGGARKATKRARASSASSAVSADSSASSDSSSESDAAPRRKGKGKSKAAAKQKPRKRVKATRRGRVGGDSQRRQLLEAQVRALAADPNARVIQAVDDGSRAKTPGVRRSSRRRWAPAEYWKSERPVFERTEEDEVPVVKDIERAGVLSPHLELAAVKAASRGGGAAAGGGRAKKAPARRKGRRKASAGESSEAGGSDDEPHMQPLQTANELPPLPDDRLPNGFHEDEDASLYVLDRDQRPSYKIALIRRVAGLQFTELPITTDRDDEHQFPAQAAPAFDNTNFISGTLRLVPRAMKDQENSATHTMVFYVVSAQPRSVEFHVRDKRFLLSAGDHFFVPQHMPYCIRNHSAIATADIAFVVIKDAVGDFEDGSSGSEGESVEEGGGAGAGAGSSAPASAAAGAAAGGTASPKSPDKGGKSGSKSPAAVRTSPRRSRGTPGRGAAAAAGGSPAAAAPATPTDGAAEGAEEAKDGGDAPKEAEAPAAADAPAAAAPDAAGGGLSPRSVGSPRSATSPRAAISAGDGGAAVADGVAEVEAAAGEASAGAADA